jgi:hypothetical protein
MPGGHPVVRRSQHEQLLDGLAYPLSKQIRIREGLAVA